MNIKFHIYRHYELSIFFYSTDFLDTFQYLVFLVEKNVTIAKISAEFTFLTREKNVVEKGEKLVPIFQIPEGEMWIFFSFYMEHSHALFFMLSI